MTQQPGHDHDQGATTTPPVSDDPHADVLNRGPANKTASYTEHVHEVDDDSSDHPHADVLNHGPADKTASYTEHVHEGDDNSDKAERSSAN